jgi:hypothetical protein
MLVYLLECFIEASELEYPFSDLLMKKAFVSD